MADALIARALSVTLGGRKVLAGVDLVARHGELLAVLGPNGAGKSTLLRALCGLVPCEGEILLEGRALAALAPRERAQRISFVPQQSQLTAALPVREVVALGRYPLGDALRSPSADDARAAHAAMEDTDVLALAERAFPDLSTGEQKRVLLARALCTGARLLLLDEPTASLDIEHALRLFVRLRAVAGEGRAVVVVLHQLEHALAYADRALLVRAGHVLAEGAPDAVVTHANVRTVYGVELVPRAAPGFRLPERAE